MRYDKNFLYLLLLLCITSFLVNCNFYKHKVKNENKFVKELNNHSKYSPNYYHYIVHFEGEIKELRQVKINKDTKIISGQITEFEGLSKKYYDKIKPSGVKQRRGNYVHRQAVEQVHIFVNPKMAPSQTGSFVEIPFDDIARIELTKPAPGASFFISFGLIVGTVIPTIAGLLIIACGCPHVYIDNGQTEIASTTLFPGAKSPQLERHDYKIIADHFRDSSNYRIRIANDENENQFTNQLELLAVYHNEQTMVIPDQMGNIHCINSPNTPSKAFDNDLTDIRDKISHIDKQSYLFNADSMDKLSQVYLTFEKTKNTTHAKLILRAKNTKWSGIVFNEFISNFGSSYQNWLKVDRQRSMEAKTKWMNEQGINLLVDIKTDKGWQSVEHVYLVGDVEYNTIAVPISFPENQKVIEVRIQSGFMFWDFDYAAIDFSDDQDISVQRLKPRSATGNTGFSYVSELKEDDREYMKHSAEVNSTQILFEPIKQITGLSRTLILHSKGYYTDNKNYSGKINLKALRRYSAPGGLSQLSKSLYSTFFEGLTVAP